MEYSKAKEIFPHWKSCEFNQAQIEWINEHGSLRNKTSNGNGLKSKTKDDGDEWHRAGIAGELAVAFFLDKKINVLVSSSTLRRNLNAPDVGERFDVKTSRYKERHLWNLVINQDHYNPERVYVLVLLAWYPPMATIAGWANDDIVKRFAKEKINNSTGHKILVTPLEWLNHPAGLLEIK